MTNKAKRNLFLTLLIIEIFAYIFIIMFKSIYPILGEWWVYVVAALLFIIFIGGYRNFSQAVEEDKKYGPIQ